MADQVTVEFGAKYDKLLEGVRAVRESIEGVRESTDRVAEGAKHLLEIFGIAFTAEKIKEFIHHMADLGEQTEIVARSLGLSTDKVEEFSFIASATRSNLDGMSLALERMSLNVQRASADAFNPGALALAKIGLSAKELSNLPIDAQFYKIAGAASKFNSDIQLTNVLMALGGRSMVNLLPIINQGEEGLKKLAKAAHDVGLVVPGFAEAAADTELKIKMMDSAIEGLGKRIFLILKPAIDKAVELITNFVKSIDAPTIIRTVATITGAIASIMSVLGNVAITISAMITTATDDMDKFAKKASAAAGGAAGGALGGAILGGGIGAIPGMIAGGLAGWFGQSYLLGDAAAEAGNKKIEERRKQLAELITKFQETMAGITSGLVAGDDHHGAGAPKPSVGAIDYGGRAKIEAEIAAVEGEIAVMRQGLERKKILFQLESDLWKTTENQKYAATMAATQAEVAAEQSKLQQIRDKWPAHSKEWEEANRKMIAATQQAMTEMVRLNADSLRSMQQKWMDVGNAIQSSFNSNLRGLLAGTTSWTQTWKSLIGDMLIYFIQFLEKMLFNWIATKAAELTATQTTEAAKIAAAEAGEAASLAVKIPAFVSDVTASVARVFAGVSAFLAPILGPAAPEAAAGVSAAVEATAMAGVPKAEQGAWRVKNTGLWMLHPEETVLPAGAAQAFRDMAEGGGPGGGSGGGTVIIQALDGRSVEAFVHRHAKAIVAATDNYRRLNYTTGGKG